MTPILVCNSHLPRQTRRAAAGFTLLEILLVLTILGMASILVVPNLGDLELRTFGAQAREATSLLNFARRNAVVQGQPATAAFYSAGIDLTELPPGPAVAGTWQAGSDTTLVYRDSTEQDTEVDDMVAVQFFPEGGSTGGTLLLSQGNQTIAIQIDPFTGRVTLEAIDD